MKTSHFLSFLAIFAILLTFFACSNDSPPESQSEDPSSSDSSEPPNNPPSSNLYCDYGPVTEYGGGCFEIQNASECDTQWGQVANACGNTPTPSSSGTTPSSSSKSSSSVYVPPANKLYCDYGPVTEFGGGCFEIQNASECDTQWGQVANACGNTPTPSSSGTTPSSSSKSSSSAYVPPANKLYCDYGPVTEFGGGCFEIQNASECDTQWGQVANACGSNPTPSSSGISSSSEYVPPAQSSSSKSSSSAYVPPAQSSSSKSSSSAYVPPTQSSSSSGGSKPAKPTGLTAEVLNACDEVGIELRWNSVAGATSYNVYFAKSSGGAYQLDGTAISPFFYSEGWPKSGTAYFRVTAVNSAGESDYASIVKIISMSNCL